MVIKTNFYYQYVHLLHTYNYSTYTNARRLYLDTVSRPLEPYFPKYISHFYLPFNISKRNGPYIRENTVHFTGILFQNFSKYNTYFCTTI